MKYDALTEYLHQSGHSSVTLSFSQLESILQFRLPPSARKYKEWWGNGNHSHADGWMNAGYLVDNFSLTQETVTFCKDGSVSVPNAKQPPQQRTKLAIQTSTSLRRQTDDIIKVCGYLFTFVQELTPECDGDGNIKEYQPQAGYQKNKPLNQHGSGSFCRFTIHAGNWPGVYLWVVGDEIIYIGETSGLARRFNTGYGVIEPVNCYVGGQSTNCKMNKVVLEQTKKGQYVKLYFYETNEYKKIELELLNQIKTKVNVKDNQ